jgi:hypothetical protein
MLHDKRDIVREVAFKLAISIGIFQRANKGRRTY